MSDSTNHCKKFTPDPPIAQRDRPVSRHRVDCAITPKTHASPYQSPHASHITHCRKVARSRCHQRKKGNANTPADRWRRHQRLTHQRNVSKSPYRMRHMLQPCRRHRHAPARATFGCRLGRPHASQRRWNRSHPNRQKNSSRSSLHRTQRQKRHPICRAGHESRSGRLSHKTLPAIDIALDGFKSDRRSTAQDTHIICDNSTPKPLAITRHAASHDRCPRGRQSKLARHARRPTRQRKKIHRPMDPSQKFASQPMLHHHRRIPCAPKPRRTGTFRQVSHQPERIPPRSCDPKNTSLHGWHALHRKPSVPFDKGAG